LRLDRRQLLKALGLGALVTPGWSFAQTSLAPKRVVFFVQPHGHVPSSYTMATGAPASAVGQLDLTGLAQADLSEVLRPLHPYRDRLLAIDNLAHTNALEDIAHVVASGGGDINNHNVAVADLLSGARAAQRPGFPCTGGAITIDQVLAQRTAGPGRFSSRVWGGDYIPNQAVAPFSFLGPSQATPVVKSPQAAFADLLGPTPDPRPRQAALEKLRPSMLNAVGAEYAAVAARLGREGREKLEAHRALVSDLERSLTMQRPLACDTAFDATGVATRQFMRLIRMAFACDLARVVTYAAPVPSCPEFNYPANADVHASYAHASIQGATSCGQVYTQAAERAMTDLSVWYAQHLAYLLGELDAVPEGNGTVLDNTVVVWLTELGTPTHRHNGTFTVLAGGCQGFFKTGRYLRYPDLYDSPVIGSPTEWPRVGPAHNRLYVSLLNALGQSDTSFGTTVATSNTGETISLQGPLLELHA
jgi:Protein of unknown function (DUF1552)